VVGDGPTKPSLDALLNLPDAETFGGLLQDCQNRLAQGPMPERHRLYRYRHGKPRSHQPLIRLAGCFQP
jgi:hypothetical protein